MAELSIKAQRDPTSQMLPPLGYAGALGRVDRHFPRLTRQTLALPNALCVV